MTGVKKGTVVVTRRAVDGLLRPFHQQVSYYTIYLLMHSVLMILRAQILYHKSFPKREFTLHMHNIIVVGIFDSPILVAPT